MIKMLVVGSAGQLGTDCVEVFENGGFYVRGVDIPEADIADKSQCLGILNSFRPNVVVNCAAYTAVDACETNRDIYRKINAEAPGTIAEWVDANSAFLVHISTDYVFPGNKPLFDALVEGDEVGPVSEYGRSKLAGEQAVVSRTDRYAILRTSWLYGSNGTNFLKTMLRLTSENPEKELKVVNDQYGTPTWSRTLALQIQQVIEMRANGIFHATSEGYCSWYELACVFLEKMGVKHNVVPCDTEEYSTPARRPANSILENARLKTTGINLFTDWKDELTAFVGVVKEV